MKKLIVLRGNSGSGKSTVARALQAQFGRNTLLIAQDAVRREMLRVKDGPDCAAIPLMQALLRYGYEHCETVILEGILHAAWYAPLFALARALYGEHLHAWYFDLPFEETLRRHQTKPNCREFGEEAMRRWWKEKDYSDLLAETPITAQQSQDDIVAMICAAVTAAERSCP